MFSGVWSDIFIPKVKPNKPNAPKEPQSDPKQADLKKGQDLVNSIISSFESEGAVNIFMKNDAIILPSGAPVAKVYGTLDYPKREEEELNKFK